MIDHLIRTDFKAVDKRDEVSTVFGYLSSNQGDVPIVFDKEKPYGVLNTRAILRKGVKPNEQLEGKVIGTKTVSPQSSVEEALDVVATSKISIVPVVDPDRDQLVGYVRAVDLLGEVEADATAEALMEGVPVFRPGTQMGEVVHQFQRVRPEHLPVADETGVLIGQVGRATAYLFVSDSHPSGRKSIVGEREDRSRQTVEGFLETELPTIGLHATYEDVVDELQEFGFAFVVDDDKRVRGIVTPEEVAAHVSRGSQKFSATRAAR